MFLDTPLTQGHSEMFVLDHTMPDAPDELMNLAKITKTCSDHGFAKKIAMLAGH